jgi:hypothetical protein
VSVRRAAAWLGRILAGLLSGGVVIVVYLVVLTRGGIFR